MQVCMCPVSIHVSLTFRDDIKYQYEHWQYESLIKNRIVLEKITLLLKKLI